MQLVECVNPSRQQRNEAEVLTESRGCGLDVCQEALPLTVLPTALLRCAEGDLSDSL